MRENTCVKEYKRVKRLPQVLKTSPKRVRAGIPSPAPHEALSLHNTQLAHLQRRVTTVNERLRAHNAKVHVGGVVGTEALHQRAKDVDQVSVAAQQELLQQ